MGPQWWHQDRHHQWFRRGCPAGCNCKWDTHKIFGSGTRRRLRWLALTTASTHGAWCLQRPPCSLKSGLGGGGLSFERPRGRSLSSRQCADWFKLFNEKLVQAWVHGLPTNCQLIFTSCLYAHLQFVHVYKMVAPPHSWEVTWALIPTNVAWRRGIQKIIARRRDGYF